MKTIEALHHHIGKVTCIEENPSDARVNAVALEFICEEIDKLKEHMAHLTGKVAAHDNRGQID